MKSTILIQGLTGMGLVAYNIAKQLLSFPQLDFHEVRSYPEFFPGVAIVENGKLTTQAMRLFRAETTDGGALYVLNGPQPSSEELQAMFIDKFTTDLLEINDQEPIDLYISFGAFITSLQPSDLPPKEYIDSLVNKNRKLFIATCGGIELDDFQEKLVPNHGNELVEEESGYITGLNGVLPAVMGEIYSIPSVTVMVEAENLEWGRTTSHLSQLLGILASKKGIEFVIDAFDLGVDKMDVMTALDQIISQLQPIALEQLERALEQKKSTGSSAERAHGKDYI